MNSRYIAYRKRVLVEQEGPSHTYLAIKTDDHTGNISKMSYAKKTTLTSKLIAEGYERFDKDTFIGKKDFVVIFKECWR